MDNKEEGKILEESGRMYDLVKSETFKRFLDLLALQMREIDTVRSIDYSKDEIQNIAIKQIAKKMAIEIIENWLSEILHIKDTFENVDEKVELKDDIIRRLKK